MPRLYSSGHIINILERHGFVLVSTRGSHAKFRKITDGTKYTVIVPRNKREIPRGTFSSILRQSGLIAELFEK